MSEGLKFDDASPIDAAGRLHVTLIYERLVTRRKQARFLATIISPVI